MDTQKASLIFVCGSDGDPDAGIFATHYSVVINVFGLPQDYLTPEDMEYFRTALREWVDGYCYTPEEWERICAAEEIDNAK